MAFRTVLSLLLWLEDAFSKCKKVIMLQMGWNTALDHVIWQESPLQLSSDKCIQIVFPKQLNWTEILTYLCGWVHFQLMIKLFLTINKEKWNVIGLKSKLFLVVEILLILLLIGWNIKKQWPDKWNWMKSMIAQKLLLHLVPIHLTNILQTNRHRFIQEGLWRGCFKISSPELKSKMLKRIKYRIKFPQWDQS